MWATLSTVVLSTSTTLPHLNLATHPRILSLGEIFWICNYFGTFQSPSPFPLSVWIKTTHTHTADNMAGPQRARLTLYYVCTKEFQSVAQNVGSALVVSTLGSASHSIVSFSSFTVLPTLNLSLSSQPWGPRPLACFLLQPILTSFLFSRGSANVFDSLGFLPQRVWISAA